IPVVVAINRFHTDTDKEIEEVHRMAREAGAADIALSDVWANGGTGGEALAEAVVRAANQSSDFEFLYPLDATIEEKIETIAKRVYGAESVIYESVARRKIRRYRKLGFQNLPICMAKTQYSLSHNPALKGRPTGYELPILDVRLSAGAGFLYPLCGEIMTMPGLPSSPAATHIDLDEDGQVTGLF
ncbi:MAG: formate--tetrahydrofolate ligase, partial [Candidatus Latescibacteria bacterium]|nr:formate--tetrahydrofolate ligase [Candidatus Latescibacterota bacterium]